VFLPSLPIIDTLVALRFGADANKSQPICQVLRRLSTIAVVCRSFLRTVRMEALSCLHSPECGLKCPHSGECGYEFRLLSLYREAYCQRLIRVTA
jgi:hypothetical protein